jgi:hypothetical protein
MLMKHSKKNFLNWLNFAMQLNELGYEMLWQGVPEE